MAPNKPNFFVSGQKTQVGPENKANVRRTTIKPEAECSGKPQPFRGTYRPGRAMVPNKANSSQADLSATAHSAGAQGGLFGLWSR